MCVHSRTNLGSEGEFWACLHLATRCRLINRRAAETNCELISKLHAIKLAPCRVKGMYSTQAEGEEGERGGIQVSARESAPSSRGYNSYTLCGATDVACYSRKPSPHSTTALYSVPYNLMSFICDLLIERRSYSKSSKNAAYAPAGKLRLLKFNYTAMREKNR